MVASAVQRTVLVAVEAHHLPHHCVCDGESNLMINTASRADDL